MLTCSKKLTAVAAQIVVATLIGMPIASQAEMTLNVGAKATHESNVNGSPFKESQLSDSYLTLNGSATYYTPLDRAARTYFIGQAAAAVSAYRRFESLNNSALILSSGVYHQLSPAWSVQGMARVFGRDTKQDERDARGVGGSVELKNQLTQNLWLKGFLDHEKSKAGLASYSYDAASYGITGGYLLTKDIFMTAGHSRGTRTFETVSPFITRTNTTYADITQKLGDRMFLNAGFGHQRNRSNIPGTAYSNNIFSVGLTYSY